MRRRKAHSISDAVNLYDLSPYCTCAEATTQKNPKTTQKDLSATQKAVLDYFRNYPKGTRADAADAIPELSEDGVKYIIGRLQQLGFLKREGGRKDGHWVVLFE